MNNYVASPPGEWRHPQDDPPPMGSKMLLHTKTGITTIGNWHSSFALWMPLPKVRPEMKDRLEREGKL